MANIPCIIPPLAEQKRITDTLQIIDAQIQSTLFLINQKIRQKQWLMQQLLTGKKRLKGFDKVWRKVYLSEYTKKVKGKVVEVSSNQVGLPCITASSFNGKYTDFTNSRDAIYCNKNDVLILWDGENAGATTTNHDGVIGSTVVKLVLNHGISNFFITYLLQFQNQKLRAIREGSGIPHMPGDFEDWFHFLIPPIDEQLAIAQTIRAADREIQLLKAKEIKLKEQKKGMMQVLLTGKKRLKPIEI